MGNDFYSMLGLPRTATRDQLQQRCIDLGQELRPEKIGNDDEKLRQFREVEAAYATFADPGKWAEYDRQLELSKSNRRVAIACIVVVSIFSNFFEE